MHFITLPCLLTASHMQHRPTGTRRMHCARPAEPPVWRQPHTSGLAALVCSERQGGPVARRLEGRPGAYQHAQHGPKEAGGQHHVCNIPGHAPRAPARVPQVSTAARQAARESCRQTCYDRKTCASPCGASQSPSGGGRRSSSKPRRPGPALFAGRWRASCP